MFEYGGIPCAHLLYVMKENDMKQIPEGLIMKRWTKCARLDIEVPMQVQKNEIVGLQVARYGALSGFCNNLCYYGSLTIEAYTLLKTELVRISTRSQDT